MYFTVYYSIPGMFSFMPMYEEVEADDEATAIEKVKELHPSCEINVVESE